MLCFRGKRAARRVPRRTEQFFLSFGEFFQGDLPAQGSGSIRAALKVRKPQRPLCPGVLGPLAALVGPEPGGGIIGPARVELPARAAVSYTHLPKGSPKRTKEQDEAFVATLTDILASV